MSALYSPRWYRVAGLKPRLSPELLVRRQRLRGETWMLLADAATGRSVRLNAAAYALAGRLDGRCTLQQAWDAQLQRPGEAASQDETLDLLAQLREAGLLQFDRAADFDTLLPHLDRIERPAGRNSLLAWRLPLANPGRLLDRLAPLAMALFTRRVAALWALAMLVLVALVAQHAPALWAHGQSWLGTPRFALLAMLLFVPIKLLHELSHGLAVRRWGGRVRQAGVTLMLGMPVPFVDASAASAFPRRHQRVIVSAAGMMAELSLAALALPLWLWLDDGLLRDMAFVTLFIASVSTLMFNANPFLRLDGYYIASDALSLPNLGPRSRRWWLDLLSRRLLQLPQAEPMPVARGEPPWLAVYAPLAWLNAITVAVLAVAWLGQLSLVLGLGCGLLLAWQMGLRPVWRLFSQLRRSALGLTSTAQRWRRLAGVGAAALLLIMLLPLPERTLVQGVVWPPDDAQLRVEGEGQVEAVLLQDGQAVQPGDLVLQLSNPALQGAHERQAARLAALEATLFKAMPADGIGAGDARAELAAAQAELATLDQRVAALQLRAGVAGRLALPQAADLPGRWLKRGALLGQVITDAPPTVRVAVPESQALDLRRQELGATVRLAASPQHAHAAQLLGEGGGAGRRLPSAALSSRHGGQVLTDPQDKDDLQPLQPVLLLDLRLAERPAELASRIGERAWVRFDGGLAPLALQAARAMQRQAMRQLNPQF